MTELKGSGSSATKNADATTDSAPQKTAKKSTRATGAKASKAAAPSEKDSGADKKTKSAPAKKTAAKNAAKADSATGAQKTAAAKSKKTDSTAKPKGPKDATGKDAAGKGALKDVPQAVQNDTNPEPAPAGPRRGRPRKASASEAPVSVQPAPLAPAPAETAGQAAETPETQAKPGRKPRTAKAASAKSSGTKKSVAAEKTTTVTEEAISRPVTASPPAQDEAAQPTAAAEPAPATASPAKPRGRAASGKRTAGSRTGAAKKPPAGKAVAEKDAVAGSPAAGQTLATAPEAAAPAGPGVSEPSGQPAVPVSVDGLLESSIPPTALIPDLDSPAFANFPTGFHDASPENFFAEPGEAAPAETETGEKRRRSRGRRGRGRKKGAAAQTAEAQPTASEETQAAAEPASPAPAPEESKKDEGRKGKAKAEEQEEEQAASVRSMRRKMFVSVLPEEQVEVVITEEGQVLEYYVEMLQQAKTKGNIYKGVIHNVDPNLQAAFVSYGAVKNGFLQIDEVHPEYYVVAHEAEKGRKYPPIQKVLKPGQEVLVQVVKEPAGTKGAFLTTYLSLPGRFLVLTPGREQIGVSRKVENEKERARLRELLEGLSPGQGLGVIVRTVSMGASKTSLQKDLQYLKRTWKEVRARGTTDKAPCLVYQEQDLTARAIRDYLTENIGEVWIDDEKTAGEVAEIAEALFPRKQSLVRVHKEDNGTSLFERFNLQRQLDQIHSREVSLPSGGRLVIDATEALTAIDINSGRSSGKSNFEDMAYRTNMEAAKMIPLQLRLRDIGGQVVADFIEMRDKNHWREVEKTLRNGMKVDRARYDVGKIGPFGMLEIVRQRLGSSAISVSTEPCPCCKGTGVRRNMEWQSQHALRDILRALRAAQAQNQENAVYKTDMDLAMHLLNHKRRRLMEMEQAYGVHLDIQIEEHK